ncbi:ATP-binding protein [Nocardioides pacificus]
MATLDPLDLPADGPLRVARVRRTFDDGPPPMPQIEVDPREIGAASVAVAFAAAAEAHPTACPSQMASLAGAALADRIVGDTPPGDAAAVGELLVEAYQALGGRASVAAAGADTLEVAVIDCPFSTSGPGSDTLCHVVTGLAGRIAARANGTATVVLDRMLEAAVGDCRVQIWLDAEDHEEGGETHRWPPTAARHSGPTPHLDLSLSLPREGVSVPVVRRLAAQALRAFGVIDDDIDDVQLAITEACANVIDHAAETDTYDVKVELAADRCAITVVDSGAGFDEASVPATAEHSAEAGRGLTLMRALVDRLDFRDEPQSGAVVHMVKTLAYDATHPLWQGSEG